MSKKRMLTNILILILCLMLTNSGTSSYSSPMTSQQKLNRTNVTEQAGEEITKTNISHKITQELKRLRCSYAPGLSVGDRERTERCCAAISRQYRRNWARINQPLSRYLETLRGWNCTQFTTECGARVFAFNQFTTLLYDYFCEYPTFVNQCLSEVSNTLVATKLRQNISFHVKSSASHNATKHSSSVISQWKSLLHKMNISQLTIKELLQPCLQVAQYDMEEIHRGDFQEINSIEVPSCELVWCGFGGDALKERVISLWTCMSASCHVKIIVIMAVCGAMALAVTFVNLSIILVMATNPSLRIPQSTYLISLAIADLIVGVIVLPSCISSLVRLLWTRHEREGFSSVEGYEIIDGNFRENTSFVNVTNLSGTLSVKLPDSYRQSVGFFTAISIFSSVYTLAGAGVDRYFATAKPMLYFRNKSRSKKIAKWACLLAWLVASFFGTLPIFVPELPYVLLLSVLITTSGENGAYLFAITFILPLVFVWIINVVTFRSSKTDPVFLKTQSVQFQTQRHKEEKKRARTIRLIVAVFTLNTLPSAIFPLFTLIFSNARSDSPQDFNIQLHFYLLIIEFSAVVLLLSNSFWNFFIYCVRNKKFKSAVIEMYLKALKAINVILWLLAIVKRCRRVAHDGKRRISNFSFITSYAATRKKSSTPTVFTHVSDECPTHPSHTTNDTTHVPFKSTSPKLHHNWETNNKAASRGRIDVVYMNNDGNNELWKKYKHATDEELSSSVFGSSSNLQAFFIVEKQVFAAESATSKPDKQTTIADVREE